MWRDASRRGAQHPLHIRRSLDGLLTEIASQAFLEWHSVRMPGLIVFDAPPISTSARAHPLHIRRGLDGLLTEIASQAFLERHGVRMPGLLVSGAPHAHVFTEQFQRFIGRGYQRARSRRSVARLGPSG